eukprot:scaffold137727_cov35-Tisochrysis_lutea.AAC.4
MPSCSSQVSSAVGTCASAALSFTSSAPPSSFLRCAAVAIGTRFDVISHQVAAAAAAAALGQEHGLFATLQMSAAEILGRAGKVLKAAADATCAGKIIDEMSSSPLVGEENVRTLAIAIPRLLRCYVAAASKPIDDLGKSIESLATGTPIAALGTRIFAEPSDELRCFVDSLPDGTQRRFAEVM